MFFVARGCTARYKTPVTNSASTPSRFALTPTTPEGEAAFAKYCAQVDARTKDRAHMTTADRVIERIGEPAARRDFPHLFMTEDQIEARMCAALGI